ncbi:MAG: hypothetical protein ACRDYB_11695 [Acidimicrobiales bacterium]
MRSPLWKARSRTLLGEFRAAAGQHAGDPRFAELIEALSDASTEFRTWWAQYEVRQSITGPLRVRHDPVGMIRLDVNELRVCAHPSLAIYAHVPRTAADRRKLATALQPPPRTRVGGHGDGRAR